MSKDKAWREGIVMFGKTIRRLRKSRGLSQVRLGQLSGITNTYISQLENGVAANPSRQTMHKLAEALGVQGSVLMAELSSEDPDAVLGPSDDQSELEAAPQRDWIELDDPRGWGSAGEPVVRLTFTKRMYLNASARKLLGDPKAVRFLLDLREPGVFGIVSTTETDVRSRIVRGKNNGERSLDASLLLETMQLRVGQEGLVCSAALEGSLLVVDTRSSRRVRPPPPDRAESRGAGSDEETRTAPGGHSDVRKNNPSAP